MWCLFVISAMKMWVKSWVAITLINIITQVLNSKFIKILQKLHNHKEPVMILSRVQLLYCLWRTSFVEVIVGLIVVKLAKDSWNIKLSLAVLSDRVLSFWPTQMIRLDWGCCNTSLWSKMVSNRVADETISQQEWFSLSAQSTGERI